MNLRAEGKEGAVRLLVNEDGLQGKGIYEAWRHGQISNRHRVFGCEEAGVHRGASDLEELAVKNNDEDIGGSQSRKRPKTDRPSCRRPHYSTRK